jgi:prepilin-type N-terminal cleavage/methylation domain-containing protein
MTARRCELRRDDGMTMIEVVVSLTLMAVLMTVFTTAVIQVYRNVNQTDTLSSGQSQLNNVFLRLDKEVRYASGISLPVAVPTGSDTWYVEYLNTNRGTEICTQLRLTPGGLLQRRTWNRNEAPIRPSGWTVLASKVDNTGNANPFTFTAADPSSASGSLGGSNFHQLTIKLAALGQNNQAVTESTIKFTALNTSLATTSVGICTEGRAVT